MGFIIRTNHFEDFHGGYVEDKYYFIEDDMESYHVSFNNFYYFSILNISGLNKTANLFIEYDDITGDILYQKFLNKFHPELDEIMMVDDDAIMELVNRYVTNEEEKKRIFMEYKLINKDKQFDVDLGFNPDDVVYCGYEDLFYVSENDTKHIVKVFHTEYEALLFALNNIDKHHYSVYKIINCDYDSYNLLLDTEFFSVEKNVYLEDEEKEELYKYNMPTFILNYDDIDTTNKLIDALVYMYKTNPRQILLVDEEDPDRKFIINNLKELYSHL